MSFEFTIERATSGEACAAGRDLVLAVSAATGFPDPRVWPPHLLAPHTDLRQTRADSVWLARDGQHRCVGHGLITAVTPDAELAQMRELADAAREARLYELGGLAVAPHCQGRGVGTRLRDARVAHVRERYPSALLVTVVWPSGPSAPWYRRHWTPLGELVSTREQRVHVFLAPDTVSG